MAENLKKFMPAKLNSGWVYPAAVLQGRVAITHTQGSPYLTETKTHSE